MSAVSLPSPGPDGKPRIHRRGELSRRFREGFLTMVVQTDLSVDTLIIGAGLCGLSAAFHLQEAGADVPCRRAGTRGRGSCPHRDLRGILVRSFDPHPLYGGQYAADADHRAVAPAGQPETAEQSELLLQHGRIHRVPVPDQQLRASCRCRDREHHGVDRSHHTERSHCSPGELRGVDLHDVRCRIRSKLHDPVQPPPVGLGPHVDELRLGRRTGAECRISKK